jgi:hypothetical protein
VFVDGTKVMEKGRVLTMDHEAALAAVAEGQQRMLRDAPSRDWAGRTAEEISPLSLPVLVDKFRQTSPVKSAEFRRKAPNGREPSVRFYPLGDGRNQ